MDAAALAILLGWAVHLSKYPQPEELPHIEYRTQEFFIEHACGGRDCKAVGWYDDKGVVYLDQRVQTQDNVFTRSLIVHELVHYLQDLSGEFSDSCEDQIRREREAYAIQRIYVAEAHGSVAFIRVTHRGCTQG